MTTTRNPSAPVNTGTGAVAVAAPLVGYLTFVLAMFSGEYFGINADTDNVGREHDFSYAFSDSLGEYGIGLAGLVIAIIAAATAWRGTPERLSRNALVLGILGVIAVSAFWSGWPIVFGATAVALAYESYRRVGSLGIQGWIGIVTGALAFVAATVICVTG